MAGRATALSTLQMLGFSIPVALHKIADPKEVKFDRASADGDALKRVEVAVEAKALVTEAKALVTEAVAITEASEVQYGVRDENGKFHPISAEAIKEIEAEAKLDTFEITEFIPISKVPRNRTKHSYYLMPQSAAGPGGASPMALLNRAMTKTKTAGVLVICLTKRQYLAVVYPDRDGLFLTLLEWAEDFKEVERAQVLGRVQLDAKMVDVAVNLVKQMTVQDVDAALNSKSDPLRVARAKLRDEALAGKAFKPKAKKAAAPAPDGLLASLEASLAAVNAAKAEKGTVAA